jgi:serine/threonine-protein kinase
VVYRARNPLLNKQVALKVITGEAGQDPTVVQRFLQEARAAGQMQHENIVGAHDCQQQGNTYYLVLEYVRGFTVEQLLLWRRPLGEREALEIVLDAARGLDFAWTRGIIHRDVKPPNVIIDRGGRAKILDLGLSKDLASKTALTLPGRISCTPVYASPEQIKRLTLDFRADVYSLGVMLYQMLCGEPPFFDKSVTKVLMMHAKDPAPDPRWKRPELSAETGAFVLRMLEKEAEKRFGSQEEFLHALRGLVPGGATMPAFAAVKAEVPQGTPPQSPAVRPGTGPLPVVRPATTALPKVPAAVPAPEAAVPGIQAAVKPASRPPEENPPAPKPGGCAKLAVIALGLATAGAAVAAMV